MKYKLTKEAIEELKAMELESNCPDRFILGQQVGELIYDLWLNRDIEVFEPIAEKLPKPVLRSVEDLQALEGWECHEPAFVGWFSPKECFIPFGVIQDGAKIRQIDMPENEYLVKDCIEQDKSPQQIKQEILDIKEDIINRKIEEPNIWKGAYKEIKTGPFDFEAKVREIIKKVLKEEAGE